MSDRRKALRGKTHVELLSDVSETSIPRDDHSADETTLSLTPSEERILRANNDNFMNAERMRSNGWCTADGIPWMLNKPKDEAALLQGGLLNVHGNRVVSMENGYFDEVDMLHKGLSNKANKQRSPLKMTDSEEKKELRPHVCGHYGISKDPAVENYITDAEVNTRGYKDRSGRVFYAIPAMDQTNGASSKPPPPPSSPGHNVVVTNKTSEQSIKDYNPHIRTTSSEPVSATNSLDDSRSREEEQREESEKMIEREVGKGEDVGHLRYSVRGDERTYHLNGPHHSEVLLEFTKQGAALISRRRRKSKSKAQRTQSNGAQGVASSSNSGGEVLI